MGLFVAQPGEAVLFKGNAMWYKSKLQAFGGNLTITDRRIVFDKWANMASGLLAQLIIKSSRAAIICDVPLQSIQKVTFRTKKALLGNIGRITFEHNGVSYTLQPDKFEEILPLLPNVVVVDWNEK